LKEVNYVAGIGKRRGEETGEKVPLLPSIPPPHPFRPPPDRLDKRKDVWKRRKGIHLPFPF